MENDTLTRSRSRFLIAGFKSIASTFVRTFLCFLTSNLLVYAQNNNKQSCEETSSYLGLYDAPNELYTPIKEEVYTANIAEQSAVLEDKTALQKPLSSCSMLFKCLPARAEAYALGLQEKYLENIPSQKTIPYDKKTTSLVLVSFEVKRTERLVFLTWKTADEINHHGFEIEISNDGIQYISVGFVQGKGGTTANTYTHIIDCQEASYIRMKLADNDNNYSYSPVLFVENWEGFQLYPNPARDVFQVEVGKQGASARLLDKKGTEVWRGQLSAGKTQIEPNVPPGSYLLHVQEAGKTHIHKIQVYR